MKILIVGGTGLIGKAVSKALKKLGHDILVAGKNSGDFKVDITHSTSINEMYQKVGSLDAVISTPGTPLVFQTLSKMSKEDYLKGLQGKFLGQVDLVLQGLQYLHPKGSFTLTSGILNHSLIPEGSCAAVVNGALESFVQSAALELPHGFRLNLVSPNLIEEAQEKYKDYFVGFVATPVALVAQAYVRCVYGIINGQTLKIA